MATYLMFGSYSVESLRQISAARTDQAEALVKKYGGNLKEGYALLGDRDIVIIAEFPDNDSAMKASVGLAKLTGISFTTAPAVTIDKFDKLMANV